MKIYFIDGRLDDYADDFEKDRGERCSVCN